MRRSQYFLPITKEPPQDAEILSHKLMSRAGLIHRESAGIYSWLPLGLRVLNKIANIVREEQNNIGAHELLMPTIQSADLWHTSGRYDTYGGDMLKMKDRANRDIIYGPTNEEMITRMVAGYIQSYRDLPKLLYHIQWKFRDEIRPRFGVMRSREFLMKDAYSFDVSAQAARASYNLMFISYLRIFDRLGLRAMPIRADSGEIGGDMSHEFVILADTGESRIYCDNRILNLAPPDSSLSEPGEVADFVDNYRSYFAAAEEDFDAAEFASTVPAEFQFSGKGIEVGHIFNFEDKYSSLFGCQVSTADGQSVNVQMGSYGIGVSRLVAAAVEASHDENGIIWSKTIAPFDIGLINLVPNDQAITDTVNEVYSEIQTAGFDVLLDDRSVRAGVKFAEVDLIGLPWQVTIGRLYNERKLVEVKCRKNGQRWELPRENLTTFLIDNAI